MGKRKKKAAATPIEFNHAMVYTTDVSRSIEFYSGKLGFQVLETYEHAGRPVYARLQPPGCKSTIALHQADGEWKPDPRGGIRLYFEVRTLEKFCAALVKAGVSIKHMPKQMPWGWKHAYLDDPDGYEISLYWAGAARLKRAKG